MRINFQLFILMINTKNEDKEKPWFLQPWFFFYPLLYWQKRELKFALKKALIICY